MLNFKEKARRHQIAFREEILKIPSVENQPAILLDEDAKAGKIFYQGMDSFLAIVQNRYNYNKRTDMYSNMLRSEHIPFNFFVPFKIKKLNYLLDIINKLIPDLSLSSIDKLEIEWAPPKKKIHLDDNTSFDVYIEGNNGQKVGIGIEIKYTEKSYPYGIQEKNRMFSDSNQSPFHTVTSQSGNYIQEAIPHLRKTDLKQIWRNHLLGASMVLSGEIKEFYSVHMYPSGNAYQNQAANSYKSQLTEKGSHYFVDISYEEYFEACEKVLRNDDECMKWVNYLKDRYITQNN